MKYRLGFRTLGLKVIPSYFEDLSHATVLQKLTVVLEDQSFSTQRNAQSGIIVHLLPRALVGLAVLGQKDVNGI